MRPTIELGPSTGVSEYKAVSLLKPYKSQKFQPLPLPVNKEVYTALMYKPVVQAQQNALKEHILDVIELVHGS